MKSFHTVYGHIGTPGDGSLKGHGLGMNARLLTSFHIKVGSLPAKDGRDSLRRRLLRSVLKRLMVVTLSLYLPGALLLHSATFRYSTSTGNIYVGGGGIMTLTEIATAQPHALGCISFASAPGSTSQVIYTINPI